MCAQQRHISAWAYTQSDQSSLYAQWIAKNQHFFHVDSIDFDQTRKDQGTVALERLCSTSVAILFNFTCLSETNVRKFGIF